MRKHIFMLLPAMALLAGVAGCDHPGNGRHEQKKIALKLPKGTPKRPTGMAALDVSDKAQAFTVASVSAYFTTHNLPMNMGATTDIHVDNVEIITDAELGKRLSGVSTGLGADAKVAFASLSGLFVFTGPPHGRVARFRFAYAVFDAQTGNLLLVGTPDEKTDRTQGER